MNFINLKIFSKPENIFIILIILFILVLAFQLPRDPDLGWHLKNGEYLVNHNFQVPTTDIYSYTMPDFPLVMHEWLTDIMMFFLNQQLGLISLMILFTLISALPFFLVARSVKSPLSYQLVASLLGIIASLPILGVRPQMITLAFLAGVIFILYHYKANPQSLLIYLLPFLFLLWANLHGGFSIGLFLILVFLGGEFFKFIFNKYLKKYFSFKFTFPTLELKNLGKLLLLFFLSILATLVNPYFLRIYYEVFTTAFDSYAKSYINEWFPVTLTNPMSHRFLIYSVFLLFLIIFSLKKVDFTYLVISLVFFFISISSWRHLPFFILISTPYWVYLVSYLTADKLQKLFKQKWLLIILAIGLIIFFNQKLKVFLPTLKSEQVYAQDFAFPYQAVEFLKANPPAGEMFNEYNWGGYLIWHYPEKKVFIDGRMPSWRLRRVTTETQEILKDYRIIRETQAGWEELMAKYQFDFTLLYQGTPLTYQLEKRGWRKIYEDELAVILEKPD